MTEEEIKILHFNGSQYAGAKKKEITKAELKASPEYDDIYDKDSIIYKATRKRDKEYYRQRR